MRKWIVGTLAVFGALSLLLVITTIGLGFWSWQHFQQVEPLPDEMIVTIDLREPLVEAHDTDPWAALDPYPPTLVSDLVAALEQAAADDRVRGLFARVSETDHGLAVAQELRDAISRFRQSGRFAVAWADSFGELSSANEGYYLSTAFDEIYVQPGSFVGLTGLLIEVPFIKGLLDRVGIEMEVIRRAGYKTALDFLSHTELSSTNREMLEALLDSLFGQMLNDVAMARQLSDTDLRTLIDEAPLTSRAALEGRLIDGVMFYDEVIDNVLERISDDGEFVHLGHYYASVGWPDEQDATAIAIISASGAVQRGEGELSSSISADELAAAVADAREAPGIDGILLRLDTPGGSAVASETIAREVRLSKREGVPVVVTMGNTAASGGYWIAMGADKIVAQPSTLTGSIGVIAGKPNFEEMWQQLDVEWARLQRGENADMWSLNQPFSAEARSSIDRNVQYMYDRFKEGVAEGRQMQPDQVEALAQGRVWTGADAFDQGLVDSLGGIYEAKAAMRELLELDEDATLALYPFPPPKGPFDKLSELWNLPISAAKSLSVLSNWLEATGVWFDLLSARPRVSN